MIQTVRLPGVLLLAGAAVAWSIGGVLIKGSQLNPMAVAGSRSAVAALVILLFMRLTGAMPSGRHDLRQHLPGAVAYAGTVILFVIATKTTTAANAILLQYTAPVWVALLSYRILGERVTRSDWFTVLIVMIGMGVFFIDAVSAGNMAGNAVAVLSGVFFAACAILLRRVRHSSSPMTAVLLGNVIAAIIGLPFLYGTQPTLADAQAVLLLGVLQLGLGYVLFVQGVRRVGALQAILIPMLEPILNPVWVAIFRHEYPSLLAMLGGLVVVAGVAIQAVLKTRSLSQPSSATGGV